MRLQPNICAKPVSTPESISPILRCVFSLFSLQANLGGEWEQWVVVSSHLNSSNKSLVPWTSKIPDNGVSYSPLAALTIPQKLALLETLMPTTNNCDHSLLDSVQHWKKLPLLDLSMEHAALLLSALFVNSSLINSKGTDHPCKVNKLKKAFAGKTDWDICFQRDLKYSASTCN
jgi:hypothetical protein